MESLVMVAYTVSLTVGYPMMEITAFTLATTVSDTFDVERNWNSTRKTEDPDPNRGSFETGEVDPTFLDGKTLTIGKNTDLPERTELTTQATNKFENVNDITESRRLKLGHSSRPDLNLGQVSEKDVTRQDLVLTQINEKHATALKLDTLERHATDQSFQSIKSETDIHFSNGPPATSTHATAAVNLESVQGKRLNIERMEIEEGSGQPDVASGVDLEDLTSSAIFPDDSSSDEDRSFETLTSSGQTEGNGDELTQTDKEVELDAVDWYRSTTGITDADLEINQTQPEANKSEPEATQTEPEVSKIEPEVTYTEAEVENLTFNETESMFSVETTPVLETDTLRDSQEHSNSSSIPSESEDSSSVSTFKFPLSNDSIYKRLNTLVSALEQLGVLDSSGQCYSVERITKSLVVGPSSLLKIELFLETRSQTSATTHQEEDLDNNDVLGTGNETDSTSGGYSGEEEDCFVNGTSVRGRRIAGNKCIPLMETDSGNWTDGTLNETDWSRMNGTGQRRNSASKSNTENPDNGALKPSRTQILVISTCSTVIGLFFIVALIMRIRNYLKRTRTLNKQRNGLRPHSRQHIASALMNDPTALALPPRTPPIDCPRKEVVVKQKKEAPSHSRGSRRFFFGGSRSNSSSGSSRDNGNGCSISSRPVSVVPPKMPQLRRQSDLSRLFISQRSQRETAKEYIRQLSLSQTTPSNAVFIGTPLYLDEPPSPPHDASRKLLPLSSGTFEKLDMA